jgi:hypothetical protein
MTDASSRDPHLIDALDSYIHNFKYLDISALLQQVPQEALTALTVRLQSQSGLDIANLRVRPGPEIIQLCLLQSPPFRDTAPHQLKDTRRPHPTANDFMGVKNARAWLVASPKTCINTRSNARPKTASGSTACARHKPPLSPCSIPSTS